MTTATHDVATHPAEEHLRRRTPPATHREHRRRKGLNAVLALHITQVVGTMWCAYAFAVIALFGLPAALNGPKDFIAWFSSQFVQLVLLPIIIVGQNIQAEAADERAQGTYKDAEAVLKTALLIEQHLERQDAALSALKEAR